MPLRDGTGPFGLGPSSGRGRGRCGSQYLGINRAMFRQRNGWLFGIAMPLVTVIVRDLLNPSGLLRRIIHSSSTRLTENQIQQVGRDTECTVLEANAQKSSTQERISKNRSNGNDS